MSWNKPTSTAKGTAGSATSRATHAPTMRHAHLALVIIVAIGGGLVYFFAHRSAPTAPSTEPQVATNSLIAAQQPAAVSNKVEVVEEKPKAVSIPLNAQGIPIKGLYTNDQGLVFYNGSILPKRKPAKKMDYEIFNFSSENRIAMLVTLEPGTRLFARPNFNAKFKDDFLKSCEVPIVANADDSEYVRELKKQVTETKIELRNRMAAGEDICQIMTDTYNELQRLGAVKNELEKNVRNMIRESATAETDVDDIYNAANKILEDKGIAPLKMTPVLRQCFLRTANKNFEKSKENDKKETNK